MHDKTFRKGNYPIDMSILPALKLCNINNTKLYRLFVGF